MTEKSDLIKEALKRRPGEPPMVHHIIQDAMSAQGMSRKELAEATDISLSMIHQIVSGRRDAIDFEEDLERALHLPPGRIHEVIQTGLTFAAKRWAATIKAERKAFAPLARHLFSGRKRKLKFRVIPGGRL